MNNKKLMKVLGLLAVVALVAALLPVSPVKAAATLCVGPTTEGCFATIPDAVTAAVDGDMIYIKAGTYADNIYFTKQLNIIGEVDEAGKPLPVITGKLHASSLTGKTWSIENLNFVDSGGYSITLTNGGNLTVSNCTFDGANLFLGDRAIQARGTNNYLTVSDSTFQNGWYVSLLGNFTSLNVSNSTFTNVKSGINVLGVAGNTVTIDNSDFSVIAQGVDSDTYGVRFASSGANTGGNLTITNSSFVVDKNGLVAESGTYHSAIIISSGATGALKVENSSILGDVVNLAAVELDASPNWWGSASGPAAGYLVSNLDYIPWCTNAACTTFSPVKPKINEFSINTIDGDVEFLEFIGTPFADYSAYTFLGIEGDGSTSNNLEGYVDNVIPLGTTDANGLYLVNLEANTVENGTISLLVVKGNTATVGQDLDPEDDGILNTEPWSEIVDSVAIHVGGANDLTYTTPILGVAYDGLPYAPGGASRIPDGFDTDAATDWVRNDFDLAGILGFTGTPIYGEAYNTPGEFNEIVNDSPVAVADTYFMDEDTDLVVAAPGVLTNDHDVNGQTMVAELVEDVTNGTLALEPDGSFTYMPDLNFFDEDSFDYHAYDGYDYSEIVTVTITVNPINDTPVAVDDEYAVLEDGLLKVAAPGVMENDIEVDGDPLTVILKTDVQHGTLSLNEDGSFEYTPDLNYNGPDTFVYQLYDQPAEDSSTSLVATIPEATVTITVTAVNDAPVAQYRSVSTAEDTALLITLVATDVEGDPLTYAIVGYPAHGTVTLAGNMAKYTPALNFNGTDTFTYKANDGELDSNFAKISIKVTAVNDAPVAQDQSVTTAEDTALPITLVATDVDDDALTYAIVAQPAHGSVTLVNDVATYTPALDFNGTDTFTYQANDGTADSNVATVTITVTAVNDAPVAVDDAYETDEDTSLIVEAPGVLANDGDFDGDNLASNILTQPAHGTLTLASDGSFTYVPEPNWHGTDTFTYKANDGLADSNIATVTITVTEVKDQVEAVDDFYTTDANTTLTVEAPGVLANDIDVDNNIRAASLVTNVQHGELSLLSDGSFTYVPDPGFFGTDTFVYQLVTSPATQQVDPWTDEATVTITVNEPSVRLFLPIILR